jgi:hypothetical protein
MVRAGLSAQLRVSGPIFILVAIVVTTRIIIVIVAGVAKVSFVDISIIR